MPERIGGTGEGSGVFRWKGGQGLVVGEWAEHALEAAGNARAAKSRGSERHESGERLAGSGDGDLLAGFDAGEETRELGLGGVDVDDRRERGGTGALG